MEDFLDLEMTTTQLCEAFGVSASTVSYWVREKKLRGRLQRRSRRLGRKFKIGDVLYFAKGADDDGYTEQQLRTWFDQNREKLVLKAGIIGTNVLSSDQ